MNLKNIRIMAMWRACLSIYVCLLVMSCDFNRYILLLDFKNNVSSAIKYKKSALVLIYRFQRYWVLQLCEITLIFII